MKLNCESIPEATLVDNTFIDHFMAGANGEFVKVYLYLLRCASGGRDVTVPGIADFFDETEGDVIRAIHYWEGVRLLELETGEDKSIQAIRLLPCPREPRRSTEAAAISPADIVRAAAPPDIAGKEMKKRQQSRTILQKLLFVAEQYFQHPLSSSEQDMLEYFVCDLHMSSDLVEYLLEYCLEKDHPSVRYMEKVAQAWVSGGITTVKQAKDQVRAFGGDYTEIFRELGLTRKPAPAEMEIMDKWLSEYSFSMDIIKEACRRTLKLTSQPSLSYADGILSSWKASGVTSLDEIRALDVAHESEKKARDSRGSVQGQAARRLKASDQFSGYSHEDADWNALSMQIMQQQKKG